jgi:hypothetical protein
MPVAAKNSIESFFGFLSRRNQRTGIVVDTDDANPQRPSEQMTDSVPHKLTVMLICWWMCRLLNFLF